MTKQRKPRPESRPNKKLRKWVDDLLAAYQYPANSLRGYGFLEGLRTAIRHWMKTEKR